MGVQKAATTTLSSWLNRHRQVARAPTKELHFFDREDIDWSKPDYSEYVCPVSAAHQRIAGDATPLYLWWPHALERMRDHNPGMRLIACFRDPLERLFSHWLMLRGRSVRADNDWPQFISALRPSSTPTELPAGMDLKRFAHRSGVARGYYGEQLERGLELFDRDQWLLLEFRTMLGDPDGTRNSLAAFLGLHRYHEHPEVAQWMRGPDQVPGTPPTAEDISALAELYADDHALFARLTGFDLAHWPLDQILSGRLDPADLAAKLGRRVRPAAD